jgi:hypothetical protein
MWRKMQFLKSLVGLVFLVTSLSVSADKEREHIQVNFYTLASSQSSLDGKKIGIRGWIEFYDYGSTQKVMLFPSEESKKIFNVIESIEICIDKKDFESTKEYLSGNIVTVYGVYGFEPSKFNKLFGKITKVEDIDIVHIN